MKERKGERSFSAPRDVDLKSWSEGRSTDCLDLFYLHGLVLNLGSLPRSLNAGVSCTTNYLTW